MCSNGRSLIGGLTVFEIQSPALALGVLLLFGYLGGRLARLVRIPAVAGYVLAGVVLGPSVLQAIPDSVNQSLSPVKDLSLGMVAMVIGSELVWKKIKKLGLSIFIISICEAITTFVLVFGAMRIILDQPFVVSALLASLATVTTPVATLAVIREYRAKGPFTSTLLGVIAADDIWCITAVGLSVGLVLSMGVETNVLQTEYLLPPIIEILSSIAIGIAIGFLAILALKRIKRDLEILAVLLGLVFLCAGISNVLNLSALLMTMTCGIVLSNSYDENVFNVINNIDIPVFIAFFTLAGAGLHIDVLIANWSIAGIYIVFRIIGKTSGCYIGARISKADKKVRRYLGPAMLTKAGLSLGLLIYVQEKLSGIEIGALLVSVGLAAITFFEITGPIAVRHALFKVGEAQSPHKHKEPIIQPQAVIQEENYKINY